MITKPTQQNMLRSVLALTLTTCITACVPHLNQQQCETMNWNQMGYNDGVAGKYQRDLNGAITDCAKFKVTVDTAAYYKGWNAGVRKFCQPDTAMQLGVNGQVYNNICPADLSGAFASAWHHGLRRYCVPATGYNLGRSGAEFPNFCAPDQVNAFRNAYTSGRRVFTTIQSISTDISALENKINDLHHQIADNQRQISVLNDRLNVSPLSKEERRRIGFQIRDLNDGILQMRDQIGRLQSQQTSLKQQQLDVQSH